MTKLKRAGLDYWHLLDITLYGGLDEFFARNSGPFYYFTTKARRRYCDVATRTAHTSCSAARTLGLPEALCMPTRLRVCACPCVAGRTQPEPFEFCCCGRV